MGNTPQHNRIIEVAPNFYNIRASFKIKGIVDIGTHMSFIKLSDGNFLVIDTVPIDPRLKAEIDNLTDNGTKIVAVIATHPFHTLAFPAFYEAYPNLRYYGCPRHLRVLKGIPWVGDLNVAEVRDTWLPEVEMRIPDGAEFVAPEPESTNHFNAVWVFHPHSRTIHVDDTIMYFENPSVLMQIVGKRKGNMEFHPSLKGPGLYPTAEAPLLFKAWLEKLLAEWDFDNICSAHIGNKLGGAKEELRQTLVNAQSTLDALAKENALKEAHAEEEESKECEKYNVEGNECG